MVAKNVTLIAVSGCVTDRRCLEVSKAKTVDQTSLRSNRKRRLILVCAMAMLCVGAGIAGYKMATRPTSQDLAYACIYSSPAIIEKLIDEGADLNGRDCDGRTPLMDAAEHGRSDIVRMLVSHGADVNATIPGEETALFYALAAGDEVAAEYLRQHEAR